MRPFGIVFLTEDVEALLLCRKVLLRRNRGFLFQGTVHSLVLAILLGFAAFDLLRVYPQFNPPNRQCR